MWEDRVQQKLIEDHEAAGSAAAVELIEENEEEEEDEKDMGEYSSTEDLVPQ